MKVYVVEYDFNILTVHGEKKPPERRVEQFTSPHAFISRVQELNAGTSALHEAYDEKLYTNLKTYGGTLKEIPLSKVLDPFGEVNT